MEIPVTIEQLLSENIVESDQIVCIPDWDLNEIIRSVCALANDMENNGDGYILAGMEEQNDKPVLSAASFLYEDLDSMQNEIMFCCREMSPAYEPVIEAVRYQDPWILMIWVPAGLYRPYKAPVDLSNLEADRAVNESENEYGYFIRKNGRTIQASGQNLDHLYSVSSMIPFDDRPVLTATIQDLSLFNIWRFLDRTYSPLRINKGEETLAKIAREINLIVKPNENAYPNAGALLFFGENPQRFFPFACIDFVHIPFQPGYQKIEKKFDGPLFLQLEEAFRYIKSTEVSLFITKTHDSPFSITGWSYPIQTIQEVLAFAVAYRDYSVLKPITVRTELEQMVITFPSNSGIPLEDNSQSENTLFHFWRNRRIPVWLNQLNMMEGGIAGILKARKALKQKGSPDLMIEFDRKNQIALFIIPAYPPYVQMRKDAGMQDSWDESYAKKILDIVRTEGPMNRTQIAHKMNRKTISSKLSRHVEFLLEQEKLICVPGEKGKVLLDVKRVV